MAKYFEINACSECPLVNRVNSGCNHPNGPNVIGKDIYLSVHPKCPLPAAPIRSEDEYNAAIKRLNEIINTDSYELVELGKRIECWECRNHETIPEPTSSMIWWVNVVHWAIQAVDTPTDDPDYQRIMKKLKDAVYPPKVQRVKEFKEPIYEAKAHCHSRGPN